MDEDKGQEEREMMSVLASGHHEASSVDLGTAVLQQRSGIFYFIFYANFVYAILLLYLNMYVIQLYLHVIFQTSYPMGWI